MARFDLTDFEWGLIQPLLPNKPRGVRGWMTRWRQAMPASPRVAGFEREFLAAAHGLALARSARAIRPLHHGLQPLQSLGQGWGWVNIFNALSAQSPESMAFIDSSIIRAHQHAAGGKKGARITPSVALVAD